MKRTIKLRETELKRMIAESVKRVLNEGKGKFYDLYYDKNTPEPYGSKVDELTKELEHYEEIVRQIRQELEEYEGGNQRAFEDYAQDKYGLSKDNLDKNWQAFCDGEYHRNFTPQRIDYPEGGTGYYG